MRNSKKIIFMGFFLSLIVINSINPSNLVKGQEYSYSSLLIEDATWEWTVAELSITGTPSIGFLDYGDETIKQGDSLSAKILLDVNETMAGDPTQLTNTSIVWIEFYLNGINKTTNVYDIGLFILSWVGLGLYYFLEPILYTNSTGTYDNFLINHRSFTEIIVETRTEADEYAFHSLEIEKIVTTTKLSSKTWSIRLEYSDDEQVEDARDPENWYKEHIVETLNAELRYNRETGLLSYLQYDYNWHRTNEVEGSFDDDVDALYLIVESTTMPTTVSYEWALAISGLLIVSIITIRRKRK